MIYRIVGQQQHSQLVLDPRRDGECVARLDVLEDLVVAQPLEGEAAEGDHLVEEHAVRPVVRHGREEAVRQALGGHPPHRQHSWMDAQKEKMTLGLQIWSWDYVESRQK